MIICDTGPLVAVLNKSDAAHTVCLKLLEGHPGPLVVSSPVLTEVCYFLETRVGPAAEARFLRSIVTGELELGGLTSVDLDRMAELVTAYADFPLGAVDASVIALAERFGVQEIAALDRRHFSVVRPKHVSALTLLPAYTNATWLEVCAEWFIPLAVPVSTGWSLPLPRSSEVTWGSPSATYGSWGSPSAL